LWETDLVADVLHMYVMAVHLGEKTMRDVGSWNDLTWGNIGVTAVLFASRVAWFLFVGVRKVGDGKIKET
jgi:hypothetical protein